MRACVRMENQGRSVGRSILCVWGLAPNGDSAVCFESAASEDFLIVGAGFELPMRGLGVFGEGGGIFFMSLFAISREVRGWGWNECRD